jgi:hypothetical protein
LQSSNNAGLQAVFPAHGTNLLWQASLNVDEETLHEALTQFAFMAFASPPFAQTALPSAVVEAAAAEAISYLEDGRIAGSQWRQDCCSDRRATNITSIKNGRIRGRLLNGGAVDY